MCTLYQGVIQMCDLYQGVIQMCALYQGVIQMCAPSPPSQLNPHRVPWARKRCGLLTQELFSPCHSEVPFQQYYDWCVFDACG